jgi:Plant mobile domain
MFHMLVGKMTITLQDVACLWGLPVDDIPITCISNDDLTPLVKVSFGRHIDVSALMSKKRVLGIRQCTLPYLLWSCLRCGSIFQICWRTPHQRRLISTRGLLWWRCLGWYYFQIVHRLESLQCIYNFLTNLEHPLIYNCGATVLAYLYRNLSLTARSGVKSIFWPLILLQMWAWTWFNVSHPTPITSYNSWGEPDLDSCQPYGRYWTNMHYFIFYNLYFQFIFCNLYWLFILKRSTILSKMLLITHVLLILGMSWII